MVVGAGKVEVGGVFEQGEEVCGGESEVGEAAVEKVEGDHFWGKEGGMLFSRKGSGILNW